MEASNPQHASDDITTMNNEKDNAPQHLVALQKDSDLSIHRQKKPDQNNNNNDTIGLYIWGKKANKIPIIAR